LFACVLLFLDQLLSSWYLHLLVTLQGLLELVVSVSYKHEAAHRQRVQVIWFGRLDFLCFGDVLCHWLANEVRVATSRVGCSFFRGHIKIDQLDLSESLKNHDVLRSQVSVHNVKSMKLSDSGAAIPCNK
jgi:hypothetical protein